VPGQDFDFTVACPAGDTAIGGGYAFNNNIDGLVATKSIVGAGGYSAAGFNHSANVVTVTLEAFCVHFN
jgi:hypothetical protein